MDKPREASISQAKGLLSFAWLTEGPINLTHHGHVVATIHPIEDVTIPLAPARNIDVDSVTAERPRLVEAGRISLPSAPQRGVGLSKRAQASGRSRA